MMSHCHIRWGRLALPALLLAGFLTARAPKPGMCLGVSDALAAPDVMNSTGALLPDVALTPHR